MDTRDIIEYIDNWLAESPFVVDNRTADFALDIRLMAAAIAEERDAERELVSAA